MMPSVYRLRLDVVENLQGANDVRNRSACGVKVEGFEQKVTRAAASLAVTT
jgi:hypothetical protein